MVNRERFMLDVDSEGFPQRYDDVPHPPATLAGLNVGRSADHAIVQALLADHKCLPCNPPGWDEVDGVQLPPITWAEEARELVREADQRMDSHRVTLVTGMGEVDVTDAARNLNYADPRLRMAAVTFGVVEPAGDLTGHGITRLSDRAAPDAYFGWKS